MRLLILVGSHGRHLSVASRLLSLGLESLVISMSREEILPKPPLGLTKIDENNFIRHFKERALAEEKYFGTAAKTTSGVEKLQIAESELNGPHVLERVKNFKPSIVVIFGTKLIKEPLLSILPKHTFNLHLGISPEYKGSATLFWPFYMLEPQYAGYTLHKVTSKIDAGDIFHQGVPELVDDDGIHDVGAKVVLIAAEALCKLVIALVEEKEIKSIQQRRTGKLWLEKDFKPEHLRVIYNDYDNDVVKAYLRNEIQGTTPILHKGF